MNQNNDGQQKASSGLLILTGLWQKEGPNGVYYVGALGGTRVLLLPDLRKEEGGPDFNLCLSPRTPKPAAGNGTPSTGPSSPRRYPPAR